MSKKQTGVCRICGELKKLSFEHIPPKKAFNMRPLLFETINDAIAGQYSKFRQGLGEMSLCESCNNTTGGWYGDAFVRWTEQGMEFLTSYSENSLKSAAYLPFYIKPLNVLKQVAVMTLAMSSDRSIKRHYELRKFVLNKRQKHLPSDYRFHVYFNTSGQPRYASGMAIVKVGTDGGGSFIQAEVTLPPFGYCVSTDLGDMNSLPSRQGLYDMSWFSTFDYDSWARVFLQIPTKETHEPFPLDFRTKVEVEKHRHNS